MEKFRIKEDLFIDKWHLTEDVLPECDDTVWFIDNCGSFHVGVYNCDVCAFAMADGMGVKVEDVVQWKYVGSNRQFMSYPEDGQAVAVELSELRTIALGMYTDRYVNDRGDYVKAVILEPTYEFENEEGEVAVDWTKVISWYAMPEVTMLRKPDEPVEVIITEEPSIEEVVAAEVEPPVEESGSAIVNASMKEAAGENLSKLTGAEDIAQSAKPEVTRKVDDPTSEPTGVKSSDYDKASKDNTKAKEDDIKVKDLHESCEPEACDVCEMQCGDDSINPGSIKESKKPCFGTVLAKKADKLNSVTSVKQLADLVKEVCEPVAEDAEQKNYLDGMITKIMSMPLMKAIYYVYDIILKGEGMGSLDTKKYNEAEEEPAPKKTKKSITSSGLVEKCPALNFEDDGNYFRGYLYKKSLPITALGAQGDVFYSIRIDYIDESNHSSDWDIADKYNGVPKEDFDAEDFLDCCEQMYQKYVVPRKETAAAYLIEDFERYYLNKWRRDTFLKNMPSGYTMKNYRGWIKDYYKDKYKLGDFRHSEEYKEFCEEIERLGLMSNPTYEKVIDAIQKVRKDSLVVRNMQLIDPKLPGLEDFNGFQEAEEIVIKADTEENVSDKVANLENEGYTDISVNKDENGETVITAKMEEAK